MADIAVLCCWPMAYQVYKEQRCKIVDDPFNRPVDESSHSQIVKSSRHFMLHSEKISVLTMFSFE